MQQQQQQQLKQQQQQQCEEDARVEVDKARKKASMTEGAQSWKALRATLTTDQARVLEANIAPAKLRRHMVRWVELAVAAREQVLEALARARASQPKFALAAATDGLRAVAGGRSGGQSWQHGVGSDDWSAHQAKSSELSGAWDMDAAREAADKVQRAKTACLEEARELGTSAAVLNAGIKDADVQLTLHEVTSIEVA